MSEFDSQIERMRNKRNVRREHDRTARELQAKQQSRSREQRRNAMRALMPEVASVVDAFNDSGLGPVRVLMAEEGGEVVKSRWYEA